MFNDMANGVLKLDMGRHGVVEDEQMACYRMLQNMAEVCESICNVAREMLPAWEVEDKEAQYPGRMAEKVQRRLDDGNLSFASSEIMPVYANYGMSGSRATTQHYTGSIVAADFMERVADDYEELDRYASLAVRWGWGFYLRWRTTHEVEMRRAVSPTGHRSGPALTRIAGSIELDVLKQHLQDLCGAAVRDRLVDLYAERVGNAL